MHSQTPTIIDPSPFPCAPGCLDTNLATRDGDREWEIYTLTDPRTLRARYVGVTHQSEQARYGQHLRYAKRGKTHLSYWIRSLLRLGEMPIYLALEYGQGDGWQERERFWIAVHRKCCDLTNATDGGDGAVGAIRSPEARAKLRAANLGKRMSSESRAKLSAAHLGKRPSPETRAKLRTVRLGRKRPPFSQEWRAKMSAAHVGIPRSPECTAKMRATKMGHVVSPETRAKIGEANRARVWSVESRAKLGAALKRYHRGTGGRRDRENNA